MLSVVGLRRSAAQSCWMRQIRSSHGGTHPALSPSGSILVVILEGPSCAVGERLEAENEAMESSVAALVDVSISVDRLICWCGHLESALDAVVKLMKHTARFRRMSRARL